MDEDIFEVEAAEENREEYNSPDPPFAAVALAPEPEDAPASVDPAPPVTVVSVDDLLDRLLQATEEEMPPADEAEEAAGAEDSGSVREDFTFFTDDGEVKVVGMDKLLNYLETIQGVEDHPMMETPFDDYTVTEGLLLLIFVILFLEFFLNLLRRWF